MKGVQSYRLRCVELNNRRDEKSIAVLEKMIHLLNEAHDQTYQELFSELALLPSQTGTKYDASRGGEHEPTYTARDSQGAEGIFYL